MVEWYGVVRMVKWCGGVGMVEWCGGGGRLVEDLGINRILAEVLLSHEPLLLLQHRRGRHAEDCLKNL